MCEESLGKRKEASAFEAGCRVQETRTLLGTNYNARLRNHCRGFLVLSRSDAVARLLPCQLNPTWERVKVVGNSILFLAMSAAEDRAMGPPAAVNSSSPVNVFCYWHLGHVHTWLLGELDFATLPPTLSCSHDVQPS
eukprot:jgi/Mesvir1/327/Mv26049-RA.1